MIKLTLSQIAQFVNSICPSGCEDIEIDDICRDSRLCRPGSLFIPLPGANFDGHDFIGSAVSNGASAVIISRRMHCDVPCIYVDDTLSAYQAIAAGYKSLFTGLKCIGITGSVGKTTTTKMTACVLSGLYNIHTTQEDNNGQRGLPASLLELNEDHEIALVEMGMSMPGEMHRLSMAARPDIAVINGIGTAHIEFFKTRENICNAKLEIIDGMSDSALLILNGDDDLLWSKRGTFKQKTLYYGVDNRECDITGDMIRTDDSSTRFYVNFSGEKRETLLPAIGLHNILDALAAVAVGVSAGVDLESACASLSEYAPAHGRGNIYKKDGFTIIDDCYNASPEAVKASLNVLSSIKGVRHIACLGDMLELGEASALYHSLCGSYAAKKVDILIACGDMSKNYVKGALDAGMDEKKALHFPDRDEAAEFLRDTAREDDVILFKGSHGSHMEKMIESFLKLENR